MDNTVYTRTPAKALLENANQIEYLGTAKKDEEKKKSSSVALLHGDESNDTDESDDSDGSD